MATGRYVVPTPQPAATLGLLNLIFGGAFLLCGTVSISTALMAPVLQAPSAAIGKAIKTQVKEDHEKLIGRFRTLEEGAETEPEREVFRRGRTRLEKDGPPSIASTEVMSAGFTDPNMTRYSWLDAMTSIPLNLAMILGGVGLLQMQEWGRRLSQWVAGLKIFRILMVQGYWIFGVVPGFSRRIGVIAEGMVTQQQAGGGGGGAPPIDFTMIYLVMYSVIGVITISTVIIYPIVSLVMLRKAGVRAACLPAREIDAELA